MDCFNIDINELFVDLCSRLPYGVKLDNGIELRSIDALTKIISGNGTDRKIDFVKPYLRSMSTMSDVEYEEFQKLNSRSMHRFRVDGKNYDSWFDKYEIVDWLNANHFDYRKLIMKGLALEAPKGMYKLKVKIFNYGF